MSDDLNILYFGGSGGFYLLHQLLITGDFYCQFRSQPADSYTESDLDVIRNNNFTISEVNNWKHNEDRPNNNLTLKTQTDKRKIYFFCRDYNSWIQYPGRKVFLYTDARSQLRQMIAKRAGMFAHYPPTYSLIKKRLQTQRDNLSKEAHVITKTKGLSYNVYYQDLLHPETLASIFQNLNTNIVDKNINFIQQYLDLHPKKLIEKLMKNKKVIQ